MKSKKSIIIFFSVIFCCGIVFSVFVISVNGYYQNRKLFEAIENNDYAAAKKAIDKGAFLDIRKEFLYLPGIIDINRTPLIKACQNGNEDIIKLLVESGADINKNDNYTGDTPLLAALSWAKPNRYSLAMYLIENGADIYDAQDSSQLYNKALFVFDTDDESTIQEGFAFVQYLLDNHLDIVNMRSFKQNALTFSVHYGNYNVVQYLIKENYFDINSVDDLGNTALITAVKYEKYEIMNLLLDLGADPYVTDAEGKTALDYANEQNGKIATFEFSD